MTIVSIADLHHVAARLQYSVVSIRSHRPSQPTSLLIVTSEHPILLDPLLFVTSNMSSFIARAARLAGRAIFQTHTLAAAAAITAGTTIALADKTERSYIMLKPDAVQRGLVGEIIQRFEKRGFKLVGLKLVQPSEAHAQKHYHDLSERPFFPALCKFLSSGPVVAMVFEGEDVIRQGYVFFSVSFLKMDSFLFSLTTLDMGGH